MRKFFAKQFHTMLTNLNFKQSMELGTNSYFVKARGQWVGKSRLATYMSLFTSLSRTQPLVRLHPEIAIKLPLPPLRGFLNLNHYLDFSPPFHNEPAEPAPAPPPSPQISKNWASISKKLCFCITVEMC